MPQEICLLSGRREIGPWGLPRPLRMSLCDLLTIRWCLFALRRRPWGFERGRAWYVVSILVDVLRYTIFMFNIKKRYSLQNFISWILLGVGLLIPPLKYNPPSPIDGYYWGWGPLFHRSGTTPLPHRILSFFCCCSGSVHGCLSPGFFFWGARA